MGDCLGLQERRRGVHSCAFYNILRSTDCNIEELNTEVRGGGGKTEVGAQTHCDPSL